MAPFEVPEMGRKLIRKFSKFGPPPDMWAKTFPLMTIGAEQRV